MIFHDSTSPEATTSTLQNPLRKSNVTANTIVNTNNSNNSTNFRKSITDTGTPLQQKSQRRNSLQFSTPRGKASTRKQLAGLNTRPPLFSSAKKVGRSSVERLVALQKKTSTASGLAATPSKEVTTNTAGTQVPAFDRTLTPSGIVFGLGSTPSSVNLWGEGTLNISPPLFDVTDECENDVLSSSSSPTPSPTFSPTSSSQASQNETTPSSFFSSSTSSSSRSVSSASSRSSRASSYISADVPNLNSSKSEKTSGGIEKSLSLSGHLSCEINKNGTIIIAKRRRSMFGKILSTLFPKKKNQQLATASRTETMAAAAATDNSKENQAENMLQTTTTTTTNATTTAKTTAKKPRNSAAKKSFNHSRNRQRRKRKKRTSKKVGGTSITSAGRRKKKTPRPPTYPPSPPREVPPPPLIHEENCSHPRRLSIPRKQLLRHFSTATPTKNQHRLRSPSLQLKHSVLRKKQSLSTFGANGSSDDTEVQIMIRKPVHELRSLHLRSEVSGCSY